MPLPDPSSTTSSIRRVVLPPVAQEPDDRGGPGFAEAATSVTERPTPWSLAGTPSAPAKVHRTSIRPVANQPVAPVIAPGSAPGGAAVVTRAPSGAGQDSRQQTVTRPAVRPLPAPVEREAPIVVGSNGTAGASTRQSAFVPADEVPVVGKPFGTVMAPPLSRADVDAEATAIHTFSASPSVSATETALTSTGSQALRAAAGTVEDTGSVPQWDDTGWGLKPTPGVTRAAEKVTRVVEEVARDDIDDPEIEDDVVHHPYTWLHMIVLVVVAFILGMLIFMVVSQDDAAVAAPGSAESPATFRWADGVDGTEV
jgi:hypothetical protein